MAKCKRIIASVICAAAAIAACGCGNSSKSNQNAATVTEKQSPADEKVIYNNQAALLNSDGELSPDPFVSYTFDFSDGSSKYMVTVELNQTGDAFELTLENSDFNFSEYEITAPSNYTLNIPYSQEFASTVCNVIRNNIDDTPVPDILEFTFYLNNFENNDMPYTVNKYYSVKDDKLCEIELYDEAEDTSGAAAYSAAGLGLMLNTSKFTALNMTASRQLEYCADGKLTHTEPTVFMPDPSVSITKNENGGWDVKADIYVYRFDPDKMTMKKEFQDSSYSKNPLYFGYKAHAVADYIAKYFTTTNLNVTDYTNYVEMTSGNSDTNDYFFKVDDARFKTVDELKAFVRCFFTEKLVSDMFNNAPQKYRDIDGALYTKVGDGGYDFTLGSLTITGYSVNGKTVTYHTKQEKFNEEGKLTGYIDGGDFTVDTGDSGTIFITQYRFSY